MLQRDVVVWNSMLAAHAQHGNSREAFELYYKMKQQGVKPNGVTFISVLGACTSLADLAPGKDIHSHLENCGLETDVIVGTALVNMYGKCEQLEDASRVFHKLNERNVVSWTAIIEVHAVHRQEKRALGFYKQMLADGVKPNTVTFVSVLGACTSLMDNVQGKEIHASIMDCGLESDVLVGTALVRMYGEFGEVGNAKMAFDKIHLQNIVSWTTMFTAYAQHGHAKEALLLYQQMQSEGVKPDKYLFINALEACSSLGVLTQGEEIHATIIDSGLESDVVVGTALIDMYGKCGGLEKAWSVLQKIDNRNVLSWTALIAGYAHAGHAEKALHLFEQMQEEDVKPDGVTFRSILSGCSHAGFVDEGWFHFHSMSEDYNIVPTLEHHACMVDLIGRTGRLEEAVKFILQMPLVPDVVLWSTLLGACRLHDDLEHGQWAADKILQLDPQVIAPYVLLSNICAADMK